VLDLTDAAASTTATTTTTTAATTSTQCYCQFVIQLSAAPPLYVAVYSYIECRMLLLERSRYARTFGY